MRGLSLLLNFRPPKSIKLMFQDTQRRLLFQGYPRRVYGGLGHYNRYVLKIDSFLKIVWTNMINMILSNLDLVHANK
jgi:hypothetical protein